MPPKPIGKSSGKKTSAKDATVKPDDSDLLRLAQHEVAHLQTMLEVKSQEVLSAQDP